MRANPPNILITNYAMLEYMLLRSGDNIIFSKENACKWQYIVFDEAHSYGGAKGIEVASLVKRVKAMLGRDGQEIDGHLVQKSKFNDDYNPDIFLLSGDFDEEDAEEDDNVYQLCSKCGEIKRASSVNGLQCGHGKEHINKVTKIPQPYKIVSGRRGEGILKFREFVRTWEGNLHQFYTK